MLKNKVKKNRDGQTITYKPKKHVEEIDTFDWDGFWKDCMDEVTGVKKLKVVKQKEKKKKVEKNEKGKKRKGK